MQGSILVEQRNELASLKNDAAFEDSAMASLQADEQKMESDERKVDDDRKRKFGKHKKRWRDNDDRDKKVVDEEKVDLDTKIRQFSDSLGHNDRNDRGGDEDDHNDYSDDHEFEKRDHIPGLFDLGDDILEDFASPDNHNKKKHAKKNSIVRESSSSRSASSESPAQILGNIARIFENVNQKNEALLVRKRKNNMLRDRIPRQPRGETLINQNEENDEEENEEEEMQEEENEFRKIKSVIPRAPKSKLTSKYDTIGHPQKQEAPFNNQVSKHP